MSPKKARYQFLVLQFGTCFNGHYYLILQKVKVVMDGKENEFDIKISEDAKIAGAVKEDDKKKKSEL